MEVYIEYVVFDNFVIDMIILLLTCKTLGYKADKLRLVCSTCIGVICAILLPFVVAGVALMLCIKILVGALIMVVLRKYKRFVEFVVGYLVFLTYTFVLGGVCYALCLAFGSSVLGVLINAYQIPMGLIVLIVAFYVYLLFKLVTYLRYKNNTLSLYYDVVISVKNKKYYVRGYVDSGNNIYSDGKPVVVLSRSSFCKVFTDFPLDCILLCKTDKIPYKNAHFIDYYTADGANKMLVFDVDKIEIKNSERAFERTGVVLGVSKVGSFSNSFDCLLNNDFM